MEFRAATITIKRASRAKNGQPVGRIGAEGVIRRLIDGLAAISKHWAISASVDDGAAEWLKPLQP
jgi:hypothetical protein